MNSNATKAAVLSRYPGMATVEASIWSRWLSGHLPLVDSVEYNVHCGHGAEIPEDVLEPWRSMAKELTQKRIDVVIRYLGDLWVVEVKRRASSGALGQLYVYSFLLRSDRKLSVAPRMLCIAERLAPDVRAPLIANRIEIALV